MTKDELKKKILEAPGHTLTAKLYPGTEKELIYNVDIRREKYTVEYVKEHFDDDKCFYAFCSGRGVIGVQSDIFDELPLEDLKFRTTTEIRKQLDEYGTWE